MLNICKTYVVVATDSVYIYQKILTLYENIMKASYNLENQCETNMLVNKAETLKNIT